MGGGIRTLEAVARYLDAGAAQVILGTAAVTDPVFLRTALDRFRRSGGGGGGSEGQGHRYQGWRETAPEPAEAFFQRLVDWGCGPSSAPMSPGRYAGGDQRGGVPVPGGRLPLQLIASGGVSSLEELRRLKALGLYGAILGKALYTRGPVAARRPGEVGDMVTKRIIPAWTYGTDGW